MKTLKLSFLVACLMVSVSNFAQTWNCGSPNAADVTATLSGTTLTISGIGKMADYKFIPVSESAPWYSSSDFTGNRYSSKITKIVIEDGITNIGNYAFTGCSKVASISIPSSVTSIGEGAISYCSVLSSITIPEGVTNIGKEVFFWSNRLTSITLPRSLKNIGQGAFECCTSLSSITVPEGVETIGTSAFSCGSAGSNGVTNLTTINYNAINCIASSILFERTKLVTINIGPEVISIPNSLYASTLTSINVHTGNSLYSSINGVLYNKSQTTLIKCPYAKTGVYTIPSTVTNIESYALSDNLTGIIANSQNPPLVTTSLNTKWIVYVPNGSVTAYKAATYWKDLPIATNKNGLYYTFSGTNATVVASPTKYTGKISIPNTAIEGGKTYNVTGIGDDAFYGCTGVTSIEIPNSITSIGQNAFYGCTGLTTIVIPNSAVNLGSGILGGCANVVEATLPTLLGGSYLTAKLTKLTVGTMATSFAAGDLAACTGLKELTLPFVGLTATSSGVDATLGVLFGASSATGTKAVTQYYSTTASITRYIPTSLEKLTITQPCTQIGYGALYGCSMLKQVTIPSTVRGVGEKALYGCSGLEHIYSEWANPPSAYANNTFEGVNKFNCVLHIPVGSKVKYSSVQAPGWNEFFIDNIQEEAAVTITAQPVPLYGGIIDGTLQYNYDAAGRLMASGNMGYDFQGWMEGSQMISANREYNFTVTAPRTLYAVFTPKENGDANINITPQPTTASIVWNSVNGANSYTLVIYGDAARTQEIARYPMDAAGNILRSATASGDELLGAGSVSCTVNSLAAQKKYYYMLTSYNSSNQALSISAGDFTTLGSTGIVEPQRATALRVYPNPTDGKVRVDSGEQSQGFTPSETLIIKAFDLQGKQLLQTEGNEVDLSAYAKGVYLLQVDGKMVKVVKK